MPAWGEYCYGGDCDGLRFLDIVCSLNINNSNNKKIALQKKKKLERINSTITYKQSTAQNNL